MKNSEFNRIFKNLIGLRPWKVEKGYGSFLTLNFGKKIVEEVETRRGKEKQIFGEWHLWTYMCGWRIDKNNKPVVGCEDDMTEISKRVKILKSKTLKKFTILSTAFDARLDFEDGISLYLFSINTKDTEYWMLFTPGNKVFSAGPLDTWSYHYANELRENPGS